MQNPYDQFDGANPYGTRPMYQEGPPEATPQTPAARANTVANTQRTMGAATTEAAIRPDVIAKTRAERIAAERAIDPNNAPEIIKARNQRRNNNSDQLADFRIIAQQVNRVQELFNKDLRGKSPGKSVGQLLPTPKMQRFEAQAAALAVLLKPMIRSPGEGTWTDKDQALLDRLVPTRFTSDTDNIERITSAKRFLQGKVSKHGGRVRSVRPEEESAPPAKMGLPDGWSIEED